MKIYAKEGFSKVRILEGFSVVELAKEVGITKQALYQFENRKHGISPSTAKKITDVLERDFDEIFELVDRKNGAVV